MFRFRSADALTFADPDNPQPGQRSSGHLDAYPLAGTQEAQATGVHYLAVKGNFAAVVEQHTARAVLFVIPVHACLHGTTLVLGRTQHDRGVPADSDGDGMAK